MNKVFFLSLWRCGTKSCGRAMEILGYRSHSAFEPFIDQIEKRSIEELHNPNTWPEMKLLRIHRLAEHYDALSDTPWHFVYRELVKWYPNSKFILTLRENEDKIAKSEYQHNLNHGKPKNKIPKGEFFIDRYRKHNEYIREFFKDRDNYCEMIIEDMNWFDLCDFLGIDKVPQMEFPWLNRGVKNIEKKEVK